MKKKTSKVRNEQASVKTDNEQAKRVKFLDSWIEEAILMLNPLGFNIKNCNKVS